MAAEHARHADPLPSSLRPHALTLELHPHPPPSPASTAAASRTDAGLMSGATSAWVECVGTNVLGAAMVTREAVADMERRGAWGHVVTIGCAEAGSGMHAVSKQAACAMAQELRAEAAARGVPLRVSTISPAALNSYFFRARAAGNKTPASPTTAAANAFASTEADDSPRAAGGAAEQQQHVLHAADVVAAVMFCLSAPDTVDVSSVEVRALPAAH